MIWIIILIDRSTGTQRIPQHGVDLVARVHREGVRGTGGEGAIKQIVEQGIHEELVRRSGRYARFWETSVGVASSIRA